VQILERRQKSGIGLELRNAGNSGVEIGGAWILKKKEERSKVQTRALH
jgi:hypothetical protein